MRNFGNVFSLTPRPLYPRKKLHDIHWTDGFVGPRAGMGVLRIKRKNIFHVPGFEPQINQPVQQSLYRLHHSGSVTIENRLVKENRFGYDQI